MAVKAVKAKHNNGQPAVKGKRGKQRKAIEAEALYASIENDPNAPLIAKEVVAYRRAREKSGEPYLTIEQLWEELGRRG